MRCSACHVALPTDSRFCARCGAPTASATAAPPPPPRQSLPDALNRLLPTGYLNRVLTTDGRPPSERRVVTSVFIDLVDSTGMAERLDPEDATEVLNLAFDTMAAPIHRYEGTIARLMGDGMLCLFGAPVAHEDDPVRACRAGLEVADAFRRLAPETCSRYGLSSFSVRVGISTGLAVVGEVGTSDRAEYTAIGDAVNLAARLQAVTEPGSVIISRDTWRQVKSSLPCRDMGQVTVRGKAQAIPVYRLLPIDGRVKLPRSGRTPIPLAGRQSELAICRKAIDDLAKARGSMLVVSGAAGLGKSRLIMETQAQSPETIRWVEARSQAHTRSISYWTTCELLRNVLGVGPSTAVRRLGSRLRESTSEVTSTLGDNRSEPDAFHVNHTSLCAVLGHVLRVPLLKREQKHIETLPSRSFHDHAAASVSAFLQRTALKEPLVLVWEDVQWLDDESRAILRALAATSPDVPLVLVVVSRSSAEQPTPWLGDLANSARLPVRRVSLEPLGVSECRDLLRHLLAVDDVPEHVATPLLRSAEGNPHFLHEITGTLLDGGQLIRADKERLSACALAKVDVPRSLQAAILARLDMLDEVSRRVIQTASVLGRAINPDVVRRMLAPETSTAACELAFETLQKRDFIVEDAAHGAGLSTPRRHGDAPPHGQASIAGAASEHYLFAQAVTQEVVYDGMLRSQRQRLHQRAGEVIETLYQDSLDPWAPILAYHYDRGANVGKAIPYLRKTAEHSTRLCAVEAAAEAYERALSLAEKTPGHLDEGLSAALHEGLGDVNYLSSHYDRARLEYDQALAAQTSPRRRCELALKRGRMFEKWGRFDDAKRAFESGLEDLAADYDPHLAADFYAGLCLVYVHLGQLEPAEELGRLALDLERSARDDRGIAQACNNLGLVFMKQRDWQAAKAHFDECRSQWERQGDVYGLATCYNNLGLMAKEQAEWVTALDCFERSLALFIRLKNKHGMARVYDNLAELEDLLGHPQETAEYLHKAMSLLAEIGIDDSGPVAEMWQSGVW